MPSPSGARGNIKSEAGVSEGTECAEAKSFRQHYAPSEVSDQSRGRHSDEASDV